MKFSEYLTPNPGEFTWGPLDSPVNIIGPWSTLGVAAGGAVGFRPSLLSRALIFQLLRRFVSILAGANPTSTTKMGVCVCVRTTIDALRKYIN
jgi:hypothetical protein